MVLHSPPRASSVVELDCAPSSSRVDKGDDLVLLSSERRQFVCLEGMAVIFGNFANFP